MNKAVALIGFFHETVELCEKAGYEIAGIIDREPPADNSYNFLGDDDYVLNNSDSYKDIPLFLVPDEPSIRQKLFERYKKCGFHFATIISPNAIVSKSAVIGEGCMIQDGCNISANVTLGNCVRVNSMANIMHDSKIGDYSTIAPSSVVLGRCKLGERSYVGANATILPERVVGTDSVVGAGAVVTKNVADGVVVIGVPAYIMR